ncbi:putative ABC transporter permease [Clostridium intestinale]|uniref:Uncharacterized membrane protein n=1 Tax=Clostridium intestinale DSM 6191 TaxID=1121320 RepID=A0A1M5STU8_9CLOT|nr:putative ABC transporter permease [Clostridium intestinale]SHH41971.1 Uncharacterized membrane protein [Clostridium intestinale DSM 6191]
MIYILSAISNTNIYELFLYFFIYSLLGWLTEVCYAYKVRGFFVNRGFLYGPFCPIYGTGIVLAIISLERFNDNIILLYIFATILVSLVEYITGFILETFFNSRWWDYSDNAFNIKGRICLSFSLLWGVAVVFIIKVIHPLIASLVNLVPDVVLTPIAYLILIYFLTDVFFTLSSLIRLNSLFNSLNNISAEIKDRYEYLFSTTKEIAMDAAQNIEQNLKDLKSKYENSLNNINLNHRRLINAFPNIKSKKFDSILTEIKNKINSLKN